MQRLWQQQQQASCVFPVVKIVHCVVQVNAKRAKQKQEENLLNCDQQQQHHLVPFFAKRGHRTLIFAGGKKGKRKEKRTTVDQGYPLLTCSWPNGFSVKFSDKKGKKGTLFVLFFYDLFFSDSSSSFLIERPSCAASFCWFLVCRACVNLCSVGILGVLFCRSSCFCHRSASLRAMRNLYLI